jgi:hypothetical protein
VYRGLPDGPVALSGDLYLFPENREQGLLLGKMTQEEAD